MQLDSHRSGSNPEDLQFSLNEIQRNTIANHKVVAQLEYSLKNQNLVKVPSNTSQITVGSEVVFSFDKSYLANNSYLNRCKVRAQYKVRLPLQNLAGDVKSASNYVAGGTAGAGGRTTQNNNHGWNPLNSGLTPFIINKSLFRREIDFSGKSIQSQTFGDISEIDELACMYDQETLELLGIYPEKCYSLGGDVAEVYGGAPNLPFYYDGSRSAMQITLDQTERLVEKPMAKRNANGKYYWTSSNIYYTSGGSRVGGILITRNASGNNTVVEVGNGANISVPVEASGHPNPRLDLTTAGVTALGAGGYQEIIFNVEEDLISDLFANIYQQNPRYYAMNSAELNFRFEQSANLGTFFKSASPQISGNPIVSLEKMELEFTSFNLGTVQIPFGTFEIPFFLQVSNRFNGKLSNSVGGEVELDFPVISYSTIPHFIKIDLFNPTIASDWQRMTRLIASSNISLKLDQDSGSVLQQMTMQDLMVRTVKNLGMQKGTWEQVYYPAPTDIQVFSGFGTSASLGDNYLSAYDLQHTTERMSSHPICPFLFLRVGEDIRLQAGLEAGMRERINLTWTISCTNIITSLPSPYNITAKITAYTCGKYVISPVNGLMNTTEVSYSRQEWISRIKSASTELAYFKDKGTLPHYDESYKIPTSMVIGGSWFGAVARSVRPVLSAVKNVARKVDEVANSAIGSLLPYASQVGSVAKKTHETLENLGFGGVGGKRIKYV